MSTILLSARYNQQQVFRGDNALRDRNFLWGVVSWVRFESGVYRTSHYSADARGWIRETLGKRKWKYSRIKDGLTYTFTLSEVNHTWAQSTKHATTIHYPRWLLLLWRGGKIVGWEHTHWCGNSSMWAISTDDRSTLRCGQSTHTCQECHRALVREESR